MRKFLVGTFLLLVVLGVGLAVAVGNLDRYLNENKAWVEEQLEAALVRPVAFDEVGLSFRGGLGVRVAGLRIGEDPDYGEGDFFSVGEAHVRVAIWPALFGRIEVTKIAFDQWMLVVVNDVSGMNIDTLGGPPVEAEQPEAPAPGAAPGSSAIDEFIVASAEIRGGTLRYVDRTADPVAEVEIERLAFEATDVGLHRPLGFRLTGELLGGAEPRSNLEIEGSLGPLPEQPDGVTPLDIRFTIDPVFMEGLRQLPGLQAAFDPELPLAGSVRLSGRASGHVEQPSVEFDIDATDALVSWAEGGRKERGVPLELRFDVGLTGGDLSIRSADFVWADIAARLTGQVMNLDDPVADLSLDIFDGHLDLDGGWTQDGRLDLDARIAKLSLGAMARALAGEGGPVLDGRLDMSLRLTGQGTGVAELLEVVEGVGRASIEGGVLHGVNLVEEALTGFTGVPGLSSQLPAKLEKKYPVLFETGSTGFDRLEARVEVRDGKLSIEGVEVDVADFSLRGDGTLSLSGDLELATRVALSQAISDALLKEARPLKYLLDDSGRVEVPMRIAGQLPAISAKPDTEEIANRLGSAAAGRLVEKGEKKLDQTLDKALGKFGKKSKKKKKKKKSESSRDESAAPAGVDAEAARSALESLLR